MHGTFLITCAFQICFTQIDLMSHQFGGFLNWYFVFINRTILALVDNVCTGNWTERLKGGFGENTGVSWVFQDCCTFTVCDSVCHPRETWFFILPLSISLCWIGSVGSYWPWRTSWRIKCYGYLQLFAHCVHQTLMFVKTHAPSISVINWKCNSKSVC